MTAQLLQLPRRSAEPFLLDALDEDEELAIARRAQAIALLDPTVRAALTRLSDFQIPDPTVYDELFDGTPAIGGHWTASFMRMGFLTHSVSTYAIALAFDDDHCPSHFVVSGAETVRTDSVSEGALDAALEQVMRSGPIRSTAAHLFPGFGL